MPQLLLEIFSEEIPARMQQGAARDLERMASERLKAAGRLYRCYETADELERRRRRQLGRGLPPIYDRAGLKLTDYAVDWVRDGEYARLALLDHAYDACVLDLGLPRRDGLSVLGDLRGRDSRL